MAGEKTILRTANPGDVFRLDDKTEVTYEGTEFPSKTAAADVIEAAALSGVQLYVLRPVEEPPADDPVERALIASGLADEDAAPPKTKPPAQGQGSQQGGNG